MESRSPLISTALLTASFIEGCSGGFDNTQVTAIDCYSMLPEELKRDGKFLATPTHTGPVETDSGALEQFQIAFKNDIDQVNGLQDEVLKSWVGIAYDSSEADPTNPAENWNPDYVFNVAFSATIPEAFTEYGLEAHFDEITAKTMFAYADTEVTPASYDEVKLVITNQCDNFVASANGDVVFPLTNH